MRLTGIITIVNRFLYRAGILIDCLRIEAVCRNHPMPHSIRMVSDALDEFRVNNIVCQIEYDQLRDLPVPSLIFLQETRSLYFIFLGLDPRGDVCLETYDGRKVTFDKESFIKIWSGVVLIVESDGHEKSTGHIQYVICQSLWMVSCNKYIIIAFLLVCLSLFLLFYPSYENHDRISAAVYMFTGLTGLGLSAVAIGEKYAVAPLLRRICKKDGQDRCKETIESDGAMLFGWISLGELSFAYFLGTAVWSLSIPLYADELMAVCGTLSMAAVSYSVLWQIRYRKICPLCVAIDMVLVLSFCFSIYEISNYVTLWDGLLWPFVGFCIFFVLILLLVKLVSGAVKDSVEGELYRERYERILSSPDLLWNILCNTPAKVSREDMDSLFTISSSTAVSEHRLTAVLSPRCRFCADFFDSFLKVEGYRKDIILLTEDTDGTAMDVAAGIIASAQDDLYGGWDAACSSLHNWYTYKTPPGIAVHESSRETVKKHRDFCMRNGILRTPAVLIDGRPLPDIYDAKDIQYIL